MENSVSAPQYPQERAAHIRTKLRAKKAEKPPRTRRCVSPRAARVFGVKGGGLSPGRLAMMAVGLQAGGTRSLSWWRKGEKKKKKKKLQGETTFTTLQPGVRVPLLSGTSLHYFQRRRPSQLREIPRENKVDPCATRHSFSFSRKPRRRSVLGQSLQLLEVWQSVCEPEIHHNGGESGRRGNTGVLPAPGSPDLWIRVW